MIKIIKSQMYVNEDKKVITTVITDSMNNTFIGQAWCSDEDTFNIDFGSKLSYLRAKRKMLKLYNSENKRWYKAQKLNFKKFCERQEAEITQYDNVITRVETVINDMLAN